MMYTSVTGIVYIYKINIILSYPLMYSTLTIRPKIKTGNPSSHNLSSKTSFHKKFLILIPSNKIAPNQYTIHQNNQNEFETEFDRTLTYQRKINFLTILNHQFSPKITYPKSQKPLQNLTIYEVLSK